jgi:hypothetical protein
MNGVNMRYFSAAEGTALLERLKQDMLNTVNGILQYYKEMDQDPILNGISGEVWVKLNSAWQDKIEEYNFSGRNRGIIEDLKDLKTDIEESTIEDIFE